MTDDELLSLLGSQLQMVIPPAPDDTDVSTRAELIRAKRLHLTSLITASKAELKRKGITLDSESVDDNLLIVRFAEYLYKKRDSIDAMPRNLSISINERLMAEKGGED